MARQNPDPYAVLGVTPTATQAEITHAYRTRLRAHHPDTRHTPTSRTADDDLREVLAAYNLLRNPARRADYDRRIVCAVAPPPHSQRRQTPVEQPRAGLVRIPVTYRATDAAAADIASAPLRAGPVRRHR